MVVLLISTIYFENRKHDSTGTHGTLIGGNE